MITAEAIDRLVTLGGGVPEEGRAALLQAKDGSGRQWLYSDAARGYVPIDRVVVLTGGVSNIESFAALVKEEVIRRESQAGEFMTVIFNLNGARFSPDDRVCLDSFTYERTLSPQFTALKGYLGKVLEHKQLVSALQVLRPSIVGYPELIRQFKKVTFNEKTNIVSEPFLTGGVNDNSYSVSVQAQGEGSQSAPTSTTQLPGEFEVELQYARGSEKKYRTTIEVDLSTVLNGERKELRFTLVAPDLPNVEELAIEDEVAHFCAATAPLTRLLILVDY
jgi:hypothetical protein